uniref:F-box protein AT5G49610-like beta-propeller domain-containing protein n=1 Tax=Oryza punctata TaxID=4537 RepID=A0A0E0JYK8_ORYPU
MSSGKALATTSRRAAAPNELRPKRKDQSSVATKRVRRGSGVPSDGGDRPEKQRRWRRGSTIPADSDGSPDKTTSMAMKRGDGAWGFPAAAAAVAGRRSGVGGYESWDAAALRVSVGERKGGVREIGSHGKRDRVPEDGGDGRPYTVVKLVRSKRMDWGVWWEFFAKVSVLRAGAWDDDVRATAPVELPARCRGDTSWNRALLVHGKLYVLGMQSHAILVLDLASIAASFISLADGVRHEQDGVLDLFRSNDAGVNLIHVNGFQARVWRRGDDDDLNGNWVLVDDICVRQAFDHLAKLGREPDNGGSVGVIKVGDDCEFMLLCVDGEVFYMDIRRKMMKKVFEVSPKKGGVLPVIHPLTMVWPPIFPVLG